MRTLFGRIWFSMMMILEPASFYVKQKRVGNRLNSGETERERGREMELCSKRVLAWAINWTVGQIFTMC